MRHTPIGVEPEQQSAEAQFTSHIAPYPPTDSHGIGEGAGTDQQLPNMSLNEHITVLPNACLYESDSERVTSRKESSCLTVGEFDFFLQLDQDSGFDSRVRPWEQHKRQNPTIKKEKTMIKCIGTHVYGSNGG